MFNDKRKIVGAALAKIVDRAKNGAERTVVGLMAAGSELGSAELLEGARLAMAEDSRLKVVPIGPKIAGYEDLDWLETDSSNADSCEVEISQALEKALANQCIQGAVALHYPFPVGVTTIGRVRTPARGKSMLVASTTGTSSTNPLEALVYNAIYSRATARSLGIENPTLGILNISGANQVFRALSALQERGYPLRFGASQRADGGAILRGNDILNPTVDICLCDSLTGNVLMKLFSAWQTGGSYEAVGWGYGPSTGSGWKQVVSIISRASGAPVVAKALINTAAVIRGDLAQKVAEEMAAAKAAGLTDILEKFSPVASAPATEKIASPPVVPTDAEIPGVDVLDMDEAVKCLWKEGIYAESAMGCTGPVIKVAKKSLEAAKDCLKHSNYI